jgi:tRNASer (uridine44-2'-O)-methyltransferase
LEELCLHPERNSSSILRAEILYDSSTAVGSSTQACQGPTFAPSSDRLHHKRKIRRKLLPKKPSIDKSLEQDYLFFTSSSTLNESQNGSPDEGLVVLLPDVEREEDVPFYHPAIRKLAFRYRTNPAYDSSQDKDTIPQAHISIAALPFNQHVKPENIVQQGIASSGTVQDTADKILPPRTFRTCMHLLETLYKHGWGTERGYEKRVIHDVCWYFRSPRCLLVDDAFRNRCWWSVRTSKTYI